MLRLTAVLFPVFSILMSPPTAELEPLADGQIAQTDEVGSTTYVELSSR